MTERDRITTALLALRIGVFVVMLMWTGYQKRISYGGVFVLHAVSTFSSYRQYLAPFSNLLFFAAWPMLAACFTLYLLRDLDTKWTVDRFTATEATSTPR